MRYFIDTEFDGHNGPLISIAIVREDGHSGYYITRHVAKNPWVRDNVTPRLMFGEASVFLTGLREHSVGSALLKFMEGDDTPEIIADSPVDIARISGLISTGPSGEWNSVNKGMVTFVVFNIDVYPTTLPGAVQHNAWWDAMALRHEVSAVDGAND